MSITTKVLAFMTLLVLAISAQAGYLDTSPNWKAPETIPLSKKKALNAAENCKTVSYYAYKIKGRNSGAMIVAGSHPTEEDPRVHLTVRLYNNNHHAKSCHVYIDNFGSYSGCNCWDV